MTNSLQLLRADLTKFVDDLSDDTLKHVAGKAAKEAAFDVAERDLGLDRAFSGFKRKNARLDGGYDVTDSGVTLNLRPAGLWNLANDGRRAGTGKARGGVIYAKRNRSGKGGRAMTTPHGVKSAVQTSRSRGMSTLADAEKAVEQDTFKAVDRAIGERIRKGL